MMAVIPVADCLAGPVLDAAVAKVRNISEEDWPWRCVVERHSLDDTGVPNCWCYSCCQNVSGSGRVPHPVSTDIAAAWELQDSLTPDERETYITSLITICNLDIQLFDAALERGAPGVSIPDAVWALVHAGPLQRTRAFLLAHGVEFIEI